MADRDGRILVTGACGQIGSEFTMTLREAHGGGNVVAVGHVKEPSSTLRDSGPYESADVRDCAAIDQLVDRYDIDSIYRMAAILSAAGERNLWGAWDVNVNGLLNVLEIARGAYRGCSCRVRLPCSAPTCRAASRRRMLHSTRERCTGSRSWPERHWHATTR